MRTDCCGTGCACDSFVSIGGGSSHDACKGARIAVSTTAGTGSETSWAYVITDTTTDPDNPHKHVAFDDAAIATLAIEQLFSTSPGTSRVSDRLSASG